MKNCYQVANIPESCINEINVLQNKLAKDTNQEVILVAYKDTEAEK